MSLYPNKFLEAKRNMLQPGSKPIAISDLFIIPTVRYSPTHIVCVYCPSICDSPSLTQGTEKAWA